MRRKINLLILRKLNRVRTFCSSTPNPDLIPVNKLETPTLFISHEEEDVMDVVDIDWKAQQRLKIRVWSRDQVLVAYEFRPGLNFSNIGLEDLKRMNGEAGQQVYWRKDTVMEALRWVVLGSMCTGMALGAAMIKFRNKNK